MTQKNDAQGFTALGVFFGKTGGVDGIPIHPTAIKYWWICKLLMNLAMLSNCLNGPNGWKLWSMHH